MHGGLSTGTRWPRDWPLYLSVTVVMAGVGALIMQPPPSGKCPQVTTVVQYLPQPEPAPLWPPASLPSFEAAPALEKAPAAAPTAEAPPEAPAAAEEDEPRRRHYRRHYRHWWRHHR